MSNFTIIQAAIEDETTDPSQAIQGKYENEDDYRFFLAYVLGQCRAKGKGRSQECVLGYQYDGPHTSTVDERKWRCFKLDLFTSLSAIDFVPPAGVNIPAPLDTEQVKWQTCVDISASPIVRAADYHG